MANIFQNHFENWHQKTAKQKWRTVYYIGSLLCEASGVTVYTTMKNYWYSYVPEVLSLIYLSTTFYTIWYYFRQGKYFRGLQGTSAVGIVFACLTVHVQTLSSYRFKMNSLLNFGGRYIYTDDGQTPKLRLVQEKMINSLVQNTVVVVLLIVLAFGMFGMNAAYLIIFEGARVTFLGTELPFVDKESDIGFLLNILFQSMTAIIGMSGCLTIEIGAALVSNAILAIPHLIHVDLEELESDLNSNGTNLTINVRLRNVFMKIQDYEKVVQGSIEMYYVRIYIGSYLFTYTISFAIFSQLLLGNPSGYGIAFANFLLLLICCNLGENSERVKSEITSELYNMPWYMLPKKTRRQVWSAIHMIQNGGSLTIGPISTLNMETATGFTKSIYSFTMLIYKAYNS